MLILKAEIKHNLVKSNGTPAKILDIQGTNFFQPMILLNHQMFAGRYLITSCQIVPGVTYLMEIGLEALTTNRDVEKIISKEASFDIFEKELKVGSGKLLDYWFDQNPQLFDIEIVHS